MVPAGQCTCVLSFPLSSILDCEGGGGECSESLLSRKGHLRSSLVTYQLNSFNWYVTGDRFSILGSLR